MAGPARQKPRESLVQRIDREEREVHAARVAAAQQGLAPARAQTTAALAELLALRAEVDAEGLHPLDWAARVVGEDWGVRAYRYGVPAGAEQLNTALGELIQLASDGQTHRGPCGVAVCRRVLAAIDELSLEDVASGLPTRLQADAARCAEYPRAARTRLDAARSAYAEVMAKVAARMDREGARVDVPAVALVDHAEPPPPERRPLITNLGART